MLNWLFQLWKVRELRQRKDFDRKMQLETDTLKSACILEIVETVARDVKTVEALDRKLDVKASKFSTIASTRNEFGLEGEKRLPKFSQDEIQRIRAHNTKYWFTITLFVLAEAALYYLTAQLFVPGAAAWLRIVVALFLGIVVMAILQHSFHAHFKYRYVLAHREELRLTDYDLKNERDERNLGYFLAAACFGIVIAAGLVRVYYLEQMDMSGYTNEEQATLRLVGTWASVLTMLVTIALAIYLALLERVHTENWIRFKVHAKWRHMNKRVNDIIQDAKLVLNTIETNISLIIGKHWQLVLDLKRIYQADYDAVFQDLYREYRERLPIIDDEIYAKYKPITCVDRPLFEYGVLHDTYVKSLRTRCKELRDRLDTYDTDLLKSVNQEANHTPEVSREPEKGTWP